MDRDRNLLFGVYAVRLEQITPHELVDAAVEWVADPSRDLSDYLIAREVLCEHDRDFIGWVAQRAAEHYGGDETATLDHLDRDESLGAAFLGTLRISDSGEITIDASAIHETIEAIPQDEADAGDDPSQTSQAVDEGPHVFDSTRAFVQRHPAASSGAALLASAVIAFAAYSYLQLNQARSAATEADLRASENETLIAAQREEAELLALEADHAREGEAQARARADEERRLGLNEALYAHRKHMEDIRSELKLNPDDSGVKSELAEIYRDIASVQMRRGEHSVAVSFASRSVELLNELAEATPDDNRLKSDRADAYALLGQVHRDAGNLEKARRAYQHTESFLRTRYESDKGKDAPLLELHGIHVLQAELWSEEGNYEEALARIETAAALARSFVAMATDTPQPVVHDLLARDHEEIGGLYAQMGHPEKAIGSYVAAYESYLQRIDSITDSKYVPESVSRTYMALSEAYEKMGDGEKRRDLRTSYVDLLHAIAGSSPDNDAESRELARSYEALGVAAKREGEDAKALAAYRSSLEIAGLILEEDPDDEEARNQAVRLERRLNQLARGR